MMRAVKLLTASLAAVLLLQPLHAIIVMGGRATNGTLDNSGTNKNPAPNNLTSFTGQHGSFLGTPVGPFHYVTATHIGGGTQTFQYANGGSTVTSYNATLLDVRNDLAIWQIPNSNPFTHYIDIYTRQDEVGKPVITIGNGTTRGNPVNTPSTSNLAGWEWGGSSTLQSWGANNVGSVVNLTVGSTFLGDFLALPFNRQVDGQGNLLNPDNGIFSGGDSGGPVFILDTVDNVWKLAGINGYVDQVSQTPNGPGYAAGLFDARGFYDGPNLITGANPIAFDSYATRISTRADFIMFYAAVPEPSSLFLGGIAIATGIGVAWRQYRHRKRVASTTFIDD
jgi:hypothetical protein